MRVLNHTEVDAVSGAGIVGSLVKGAINVGESILGSLIYDNLPKSSPPPPRANPPTVSIDLPPPPPPDNNPSAPDTGDFPDAGSTTVAYGGTSFGAGRDGQSDFDVFPD